LKICVLKSGLQFPTLVYSKIRSKFPTYKNYTFKATEENQSGHLNPELQYTQSENIGSLLFAGHFAHNWK